MALPKILITGATGGVGAPLVAELVARSQRVRALVRRRDARSRALEAQGVEIAVGDLNGDSNTDLAVINGLGGTTVLLGDGTGGFAAAPGGLLSTGSQESAVMMADFNQDGKVNSIDFSILLYFWKTKSPFRRRSERQKNRNRIPGSCL